MNLGFISIPIHGNLFGLDLSNISLLKNLAERVEVDNSVNIHNAFNLVIHTAPQDRPNPVSTGPPPLPKPHVPGGTRTTTQPPAEQNDDAERTHTPSSHSPAQAPCALHTTMVFDDRRICDFPSLSLGEIQLFVLLHETVTVRLDDYPPLTIDRTQGSAEFRPVAGWAPPTRPLRLKSVTEYHGQPVRISSLRRVSQVCSRGYSATLYRVPLGKDPLGKEILLAGQTCRFSPNIFKGVFLAAVRRHRSQGGVFLRKLAIVAMPNPRKDRSHARE